MTSQGSGPTIGQAVLRAGSTVSEAHAAVVLLHGRGAQAGDMIELSERFRLEGVAYLSMQAPGNTWYPFTFLHPVEQNEPSLTFALQSMQRVLGVLQDEGISSDRTMLLGFSQGGCLALEYAARHPVRYGGVVGLSAGLVGPPGTVWDTEDSLDGTPVFLGCSDVDTHIPRERVVESAEALGRMGGNVDMRFYDGMPHTINLDEMEMVGEMVGEMKGLKKSD